MSNFAKITIGFAAAFLIGIGLCGLSYVLPSSDSEFHTNWLSAPSLLLMVVSLPGLLVTLVCWVIAKVFPRSSFNDPKPQTLFGDSEKDSDNSNQTPR